MKHLLLSFFFVAFLSCDHATNSTKNCLPKEKEKSLVALGQLWGFLKYHYPIVAEGKLDWDKELIEIIPTIMNTQDEEGWKIILDNWIDSLPPVEVTQKDSIPLSRVKVKADYGKLFNTAYLHQKTIDKLQFILDNTQIRENHFIKLNYRRTSNEPFVIITNETTYEDMAFPELPYRILALFRYWNIVNYFFPYRELCDTKWSEVLPEMLPEFVCAENQKEYTLACLKLSAKIDDSHGGIRHNDTTMFYEIYGRRKVPFETRFIENKLVVLSFSSDYAGIEKEISVGDIITTINGEKVETVVERLLPYTPASNYEVKLRNIAMTILQTNDNFLRLNFLQNGKSVNKKIQTYDIKNLKIPNYYSPKPNEKGYKIIQDSIGYIFPANCKQEERESEVARIMSNTKGLVIDLRCYPSDYNATAIAPYLMKDWGYYSRKSLSNISMPGYFLIDNEKSPPSSEIGSYPYKVVIIVNEYTQSSAEDHTFFYYLAPQVTIIGSTTAGANGAVFLFPLPG
uniref:S41 family peptidase n=1 Tax=uncultured Proteiniphilum sp. TaxID=497637 RepID=UPI00261ED388